MPFLKKHIPSYLLSVLLLLLLLPLAADAAWSTLRDVQGAERNILEIDGHRRAYWKVDAEKSLEIEVTGPSRVRIYSRAPYKMSHKGKKYAFSALLDGSEMDLIHHAVSRSRAVYRDSGKAIRMTAS